MKHPSKGLTKRTTANVPLLARNECFGNALRKAREDAGMDRKMLAAALGMSQRRLVEIEDGERAPMSFELIVAVAQFMGWDSRVLPDAALKGTAFNWMEKK